MHHAEDQPDRIAVDEDAAGGGARRAEIIEDAALDMHGEGDILAGTRLGEGLGDRPGEERELTGVQQRAGIAVAGDLHRGQHGADRVGTQLGQSARRRPPVRLLDPNEIIAFLPHGLGRAGGCREKQRRSKKKEEAPSPGRRDTSCLNQSPSP